MICRCGANEWRPIGWQDLGYGAEVELSNCARCGTTRAGRVRVTAPAWRGAHELAVRMRVMREASCMAR